MRKIINGVYGAGPEDPSGVDVARAVAMATGGIACASFSAVLLELDAVEFRGTRVAVPPGNSSHYPGVRRRVIPSERVIEVHGVRCADGVQTMLDLAAELDDDTWEQSLESALRKKLTTIPAIEAAARGVKDADRIRRVLARRPPGAPPTESLLETLMVQLARTVPDLPAPTRQLEVFTPDGIFVARVDLAWPELGIFIELDGPAAQGSAGVRRPSPDRGDGGDGLALRSVHLARSRAPEAGERQAARRDRRTGTPSPDVGVRSTVRICENGFRMSPQ